MASVREHGTVTIDFIIPENELPAPLPSIADILSSQDPIYIHDYRNPAEGYEFVRVGEHFLVKCGGATPLFHILGVLFNRRVHHEITFSKVYAIITHKGVNDGEDMVYVVMDCVDGRRRASRASGRDSGHLPESSPSEVNDVADLE
jgi:hypothetical protein